MVIRFQSNYITPLLCTASAAAAGYYFFPFIHIFAAAAIIIILIIAFCFFRVLSMLDNRFSDNLYPKLRLISICLAAAAAGFILGTFTGAAGQNNINFGLPENNITAVEGVLLEDPRVLPGGSVMALISLKRCAGENVRVSSSGEITLFFPSETSLKLREFGRGTTVFAEGNLRSSDRGYSFSAVSLHITKTAPAIERMRTGIRLNLINRFEKHSWGGLALALLVGIRDNLDVNLTAVYRDAGLSYILALSGMHLAVITALIAFVLKKPLGLKGALITGAVIICLYCFLVGPMPSLIRSAIMYLLGICTILFALPKKSISILCLSFLIQIILTPAAGNSLSFILSYLALLGIIVTSRQVSSLLSGKIPDFILQPLSLSCGAFLATAGICSFSFGTIAPIGIIAGLFIVPLTTLFMVGSIIWLLFDFISLSFVLSYPLSWIYWLMEIVSSLAGFIPGIKGNPIIILIISLVLILMIAIFHYRQKKAQLMLKKFK